jgi:hypothetical protein
MMMMRLTRSLPAAAANRLMMKTRMRSLHVPGVNRLTRMMMKPRRSQLGPDSVRAQLMTEMMMLRMKNPAVARHHADRLTMTILMMMKRMKSRLPVVNG